MKKIISILLASAMIFSLTACGGGSGSTSSTTAAGASGETASGADSGTGAPIVVNVCEHAGNAVDTLAFYSTSKHSEWQYAECCYDALLHASYDGKFEPEICTSYELSDDGLSAILHLADGVHFQDGTVLNADDVVCTLNYIAENINTLAMVTAVWGNLLGAEKIDDLTVKVNMSRKYHAFDTALGYTYIFSDEDYAKYGDQMWAQGVINGSGPWVYKEWIDGQRITFTRNDNYWKGVKTNVDELNIWYTTEANTIVSSLISGELDAVANVSYDLLPMLEGNESFNLTPYTLDNLNYIQFKCGSGDAFEDINMRKAVMHAINLEAFLDFYGGGIVLPCAATPGNDGYVDLGGYKYDPELAKEYLAKTNYNGETLSLASWTYKSNECTAIASDLAAIGINVSLNLCDSAAFSTVRKEGTYDLFYASVATWDGDLMTQYMLPRIAKDTHSHGYQDDHIDEVLYAADEETDREKRKAMLEEVITWMYNNYGPICGTISENGTRVVRKGLEGINCMAGGKMFFRDVYVDTSIWKK